jgi:hypothetical protein
MLHFPCRLGQGDIIVQDTQQAFSAVIFAAALCNCLSPSFWIIQIHRQYCPLPICRSYLPVKLSLVSEQVDKHRPSIIGALCHYINRHLEGVCTSVSFVFRVTLSFSSLVTLGKKTAVLNNQPHMWFSSPVWCCLEHRSRTAVRFFHKGASTITFLFFHKDGKNPYVTIYIFLTLQDQVVLTRSWGDVVICPKTSGSPYECLHFFQLNEGKDSQYI